MLKSLRQRGGPQMWLEATGQIFFSLSVGFGIIITYSSYLRRNDDVALSSLTSCAATSSARSRSAASSRFPPPSSSSARGGRQGQGDVRLRWASRAAAGLRHDARRARLIGTIFFLLLFLAAITSSLSMLQPAIALLEEGLGLDRKRSAWRLLGGVTLLGALFVVFFSKGLTALDTIDFWVGTFCIFLLAGFQTILFGWVMGIERAAWTRSTAAGRSACRGSWASCSSTSRRCTCWACSSPS